MADVDPSHDQLTEFPSKERPRRDSPCPDVEVLRRFAKGLGELDAGLALAEHVGDCESCESIVSELERDRASIWQALRDAVTGEKSLADTVDAHRNPEGTAAGGVGASRSEQNDVSLDRIGSYELLGELGRGGMGVVYRAFDARLDRVVALKTIRSERLDSEDALNLFLREAKATAHLDHRGIVPVFDVGEASGVHFLTMPFVNGQNLAEITRDSPLPDRRIGEIVHQVADAVHYAHERNVVHRDIKPHNILLDANGEVKVTDFGLAKRVDQDDGNTQTGDLRGTPSYMAPEQAIGDIELVGFHSDVYAIGAVLYFLLVGKPPFSESSVSKTLLGVINDDPVSPAAIRPEAARDLVTICLKCLAKEPERRYDSAAALRDDLNRYLRNEPILARPTSVWERVGRWMHRNPATARLTAVAVCLTILIVVGSIYFWQARAQQRARTEFVTAQTNAFDTLLASNSFAAEERREAEAILDKLRELDPEHDDDRLLRLVSAVVAGALSDLATPRIDDNIQARVDECIVWLSRVDDEAASTVELRQRERARNWNLEITFAELLEDLPTYCDPQLLTRVDNALVSRYPESPFGTSRIPINVDCRADFRVDATFSTAVLRDEGVGVALDHSKGASDSLGVAFMVSGRAGADRKAFAPPLPGERARPSIGFKTLWRHETGPGLRLRHAVAFSPDERFLVLPSSRESFIVLSTESGEVVHEGDALNDAGFAFGFVPTRDDEHRATPESQVRSPFINDRYELTMVSIEPIRATTFDSTGEHRETKQLAGLGARLFDVHALRRLALVYEGNELCALSWDDDSEQRRLAIAGEVQDACFSPDGRHAIFVDDTGATSMWHVAENRAREFVDADGQLRSLSFLGDGSAVVVSTRKRALVFDARTLVKIGELTRRYPLGQVVPCPPQKLSFHISGGPGVTCLDAALSDCGVWSFPAKARQRSLAVSPSGGLVATTDSEGGVSVAKVSYEDKANRDADLGPTIRSMTAAIERAGVAIRSESIEHDTDSKLVRLRCQRVGTQLTLQIGEREPIVFDDLFVGDTLADERLVLRLPRGDSLVDFKVEQKTPAVIPSLLEKADSAYSRESYSEAAELYQQQRQKTTDAELVSECDYKEALCLLQLNRHVEATEQLEQLASKTTGQWAKASLVQLWLHSLRQGGPKDQDRYFELVSSQFDYRTLLSLMTDRDRLAIQTGLPDVGSIFSVIQLLRRDPQRTHRLQQSARMLNYLARDTNDATLRHHSRYTRIWLSRDLQMSGQAIAAVPINEALYHEVMADPLASDETVAWMTEEYARIMRQSGRFTGIDELLGQAISRITDEQSKEMLGLEFARMHVALGRLQAAETQLRNILSNVTEDNLHARTSATFMLGAICEKNGQDDDARALYRQVGETFDQRLPRDRSMTQGDLLRGLIAKARIDDVDAASMSQIMRLLYDAEGKSTSTILLNNLDKVTDSRTIARAFTKAWQGPEAWDDYWQVATDSLSLVDRYRVPMIRFAVSLANEMLFAGNATVAEMRELRTLMSAGYHGAAETDQIGITLGVAALGAWQSPTTGWLFLKPSLPKDKRLSARICWFMAVRFQQQGSRRVAIAALETAAQLAQQEPQLVQLVNKRLKKLSELD